jgi:hypothetical protein
MLNFASLLAPALLIVSVATASSTKDASDVTTSLYCLAHSRFAFKDDAKASAHRVRYLIDTKSFVGERHILLFIEAGGRRIRWFDVDVFGTLSAPRYRFTNNAEFIAGRKGPWIYGPPLGGIWSNDRFERAWARVRRQPAVLIKTERKRAYRQQCQRFDELFS